MEDALEIKQDEAGDSDNWRTIAYVNPEHGRGVFDATVYGSNKDATHAFARRLAAAWNLTRVISLDELERLAERAEARRAGQ